MSEKLEDIEIICVIGGPGVGKGTQCKKLAKDFNAVHVSIGDLLRAQKDKLKAVHNTDLDELMVKSQMVDKDLAQEYLEECLLGHVNRGKRRFLVDGFPRIPDQARYCEGRGLMINAVLYFKSTEETALVRMLNRARSSGPRAKVDDTPDIFQKRYEGFKEQIKDIVSYFAQSDRLCEVDCEGDLRKTYMQVVKQVMVITGESPRSMLSLVVLRVERLLHEVQPCVIATLWFIYSVYSWLQDHVFGT